MEKMTIPEYNAYIAKINALHDRMNAAGLYALRVTASKTGLYTPAEVEEMEDAAELFFPAEMIEAYYAENKTACDRAIDTWAYTDPITYNWKTWQEEASTPKTADGIIDFAMRRGFAPEKTTYHDWNIDITGF